MTEPNRRMYELEYPSPSVKSEGNGQTTLVVALQGYADAGHAIELASDHLKAALDSRPLAHFNNDELIDYRSRRPAVTIEHNNITNSEDLTLDMRVLRDPQGHSFLLLSGPEPDLRWEAFTQAVADLVEQFDVTNTISLYSAPMTVPHTRPLVVSGHGNAPELLRRMFGFDSRLIVPGSASLYLERELHRRGRNVAGYTAQVPHYLSASPYPEAALKLLQAVSEASGLKLPLGSLERDAQRIAEQVSDGISDNQEIQQIVAALEQQYDEEISQYRESHPQAMLPGEPEVPSGEQIGEEFERFLAGLDQPHQGSEDHHPPLFELPEEPPHPPENHPHYFPEDLFKADPQEGRDPNNTTFEDDPDGSPSPEDEGYNEGPH
ncbi:PAC2 family protein [Corynebacterium poyangense]|uniref:PAC2 family protein n=1 Tax=Corynebacterium poyangense TaxID=2684405 RepID=A0A7H0SP94_9CORY|nr:PAC2 family protein [Corynebacterium poyangense]QNQ90369.1 PAC2 family protein [Corynebacterium poyangense]